MGRTDDSHEPSDDENSDSEICISPALKTAEPPLHPPKTAELTEDPSIIDGLLVTEHAASETRLTQDAPSDTTVHTQEGSPSDAPPPPSTRHRESGAGAVLPHLRQAIRVPEPPAPEPTWRDRWLSGPPLVGLVVFVSILVGLPAVACCLGRSNDADPVETPTEVDGVRVRPNLR